MESNGFFRELLERFVFEDPKRIAFSLYDGRKIVNISYSQFVNDVLTATGYFHANHIKKHHIALIAPNSYKWIVVFFAILTSGNIAVLLDSSLSPQLLQSQCKKADVDMIYTEGAIGFELRETFSDISFLTYNVLKNSVTITLDSVSTSDPEDTIILIGTSGTTGKAKIAEITSDNIRHFVASVSCVFCTAAYEKMLLILPLHHIGGIAVVITGLYLSKNLCIGRGVRYLFSDMPIFNPTDIALVPAILESLEKLLKLSNSSEDHKKYIGNRLQRIHVAGASSKASSCKYLMQEGFLLNTSYGMTETTGLGTWCILDKEHIGTIGKLLDGIEARILNGELLLKGPTVISGYYRNPYETSRTIIDGWLHTGDLVSCDSNGFFYLTGRKKNVIILSNGENVNPEDIEEFLNECSAVLECMVYGNIKGICADIYTHHRAIVETYIKAYSEKMPMYRHIYKVNYYEQPLEKTSSGKLKRKDVTS